jgi:YegS/Rv2252/BmrU family lipid kinase
MMSGRKRIDIIVNPAAGSRNSGLFDAVVRRLHDKGAFVRCFDTEGPGHASELAATCAQEAYADAIVAAGGDGTINEVARGLLGHPTPLGVLPLGTANVLAIELGQRLRARSIADTLLHGDAKLIGTGQVNGEMFLLMVGAGFDGAVVAAIKPEMKRRFGKFAFVWEGLKTWFTGPGHSILTEIDGELHEVAWVVVTNARHYAGPFVLAPTVDIAEPYLQVFIFKKHSRLAFAGYFLGLSLGQVARMPGVQVFRFQKLELSSVEPVPVEVDGDAFRSLPLTISQGTQFLRLVVPQA